MVGNSALDVPTYKYITKKDSEFVSLDHINTCYDDYNRKNKPQYFSIQPISEKSSYDSSDSGGKGKSAYEFTACGVF